MLDPIVSTKDTYDYVPGLNKIVHTIRKHFKYKVGSAVDTVEHHVIPLYDTKGKVHEYNAPHKIDKLA